MGVETLTRITVDAIARNEAVATADKVNGKWAGYVMVRAEGGNWMLAVSTGHRYDSYDAARAAMEELIEEARRRR
ncbi:MAG: hypothetical protein KatS3mg005_3390 [Bryobacteraceae bacterium]|nr:MAG: hypothetical protein KatS3mg005_3390 [Bryobacteraceae bacterium]